MRDEDLLQGFKPLKRMGQNFLLDEGVLKKEVDWADVEGKTVLEIGAGIGNLTEKLCEQAFEVIAVEKDSRLLPLLKKRLSKFSNVEIVHADFLNYLPPQVDRIVSNVPYPISSPIVFKLSECDFELATLCLQKEFAERLVAEPGERKRSRISVMAQESFELQLLGVVPKEVFTPVPKVDSAIIQLKKKNRRPPGKFFSEFVKALFSHKRKTAWNSLLLSAGFFGADKTLFSNAVKKIVPAKKRPSDFSNEEIREMAVKMEAELSKGRK